MAQAPVRKLPAPGQVLLAAGQALPAARQVLPAAGRVLPAAGQVPSEAFEEVGQQTRLSRRCCQIHPAHPAWVVCPP